MERRVRAKMSAQERAKQFLPFAALTGLGSVLAQAAELKEQRPALSEEAAEALDRVLRALQPGQMLDLSFWAGRRCRLEGRLDKLSAEEGWLQLAGQRLYFVQLLDCRIL